MELEIDRKRQGKRHQKRKDGSTNQRLRKRGLVITDSHVFFHQEWPSQWFPAKFVVHGLEYNCCEQYMMAEKARLFNDIKKAEQIMKSHNPAVMKKLGQAVRGFKQHVWDQQREKIVFEGNYARFSQDKKYKKKLLETGDRLLVEASPKDKIWGIGLATTNKDIHREKKWPGLNLLGKCITAAREMIKVDLGLKEDPFAEKEDVDLEAELPELDKEKSDNLEEVGSDHSDVEVPPLQFV